MHAEILPAALAVLASLIGILCLRGSSLERSDSGVLLGVVFCFVAIVFILIAVAAGLSS
jgi:hypothetical protein